MSAGLAASTVTPGSTAPVVSLTSPASVACAAATRGTTAISPNNRKHLASVRMWFSTKRIAGIGVGRIEVLGPWFLVRGPFLVLGPSLVPGPGSGFKVARLQRTKDERPGT